MTDKIANTSTLCQVYNREGFKDQNSYKFCGQLTCGLRISSDPTTDTLTPQETTSQDAPDMGVDRADLFCPSSSVVANHEQIKG